MKKWRHSIVSSNLSFSKDWKGVDFVENPHKFLDFSKALLIQIQTEDSPRFSNCKS